MSTALFEINRPLQAVNFVGWLGRDCGEHRTVGDYRAWCHGCSEWCYSSSIDSGCHGCRMPLMERTRDRYWAMRRALDLLLLDAEEKGKRKVKVADIEAAMNPEVEVTTDSKALGSVFGITTSRTPSWTDAQRVINEHRKHYADNPDLLVAVSSADVLRRFWSLGWYVP